MNLRDLQLNDRFRISDEPALVSGPQALVRLMLQQREIDRRAGLNTAGYVTGYRGSPLGGVDFAFWSASQELAAANIVFVPGVNEDLAATAVWGTQQLATMGQATVDGVFGMWYGKGPGVDRSGDPFKHANRAGTHPRGGVLAVFGDDHGGKSSTVAHSSEQAVAAHNIPVLYPPNVGEIVRFGLIGYALSRYSGCWVGLKVINDTIEQTAVADIKLDKFHIETPDPSDLMPPEGVHYRGQYAALRDEGIMLNHKLPLVARFARANRIDQTMLGMDDAGPRRLGIVTAGKAYQDVMQALRYLGIDEPRACELGLSVYKVGMIWPLEAEGLKEFALGRSELFFVEEKAAFVEPQAAAILYNEAQRPRITGKRDEAGKLLLSLEQPLDPMDVVAAVADRMKANGIGDPSLDQRLAELRDRRGLLLSILPTTDKRSPYFCSGCPHNTSTAVPEGSVALAGIGCHGMAMWAKPNTRLSTQMGGEGATWFGLHHFTGVKHVFQNLGDGTYYHSGLMAIRGAVASGANITYKLLFNDAVAMTGGQPVDGPISVGAIAHQVLHEGVKKIVVVTDEPERYAGGGGLPAGVAVLHRDALDTVQKEMREIAGCTVMIYDQTCAAEKRRRRKLGTFPDPDKRMFINQAVCEACGDCSSQSGCVSIEVRPTADGGKRAINQSSCNKDYSCVKGFCPSFVTVKGGSLRKPKPGVVDDGALERIPVPKTAAIDEMGYGIMVSGIGGTGVITVGALLTMAAHLEHKAPSSYDMTGMSQKNGGVHCHVRIANRPQDIHSQRLGLGEAALLLGFDLIAALAEDSFRTISSERSFFIGNERVQPTSALIANPDDKIDTGLLRRKVRDKLPAEKIQYVDASGLSLAFFGDTIGSNMLMLGAAAQMGLLPVGIAAIERAIELNGTQVAMNQRALRIGRLSVHDPVALQAMLASTQQRPGAPGPQSLDELMKSRMDTLTRYQNAAYAQRYLKLVRAAAEAERRAAPASELFMTAVAHYFSKLMAYKDEFEVARLYADGSFMSALKEEFDGKLELKFNLAPPIFSRRDPATGHLMKKEYGSWMLTAMKMLAAFKGLRGTAFDPFGRTAERRAERALIAEYEATILELLPRMTAVNLATAVTIAEVPERIRGYGHVKDRHMQEAAQLRERALNRFDEECMTRPDLKEEKRPVAA